MAIPKGKGGGRDVECFEGFSPYNNKSSAASLHQAIQHAARRAALQLEPGDTREFEVSRIQIVVGNPNVKVYKVVITPTG